MSADARSVSKRLRHASLQPRFLSRSNNLDEPLAPNFDQMIQDSQDMLNNFENAANAVEPPKAIVPAHAQESQSLPQPENTKEFEDTIFVVRAHKKYGTEMVNHYANQLRGSAAVWCIYDTTHKSDKKSIDNLRALEGRNDNFHFLTVNDDTIRALFPNTKWQWQDDHLHVTPAIGYYMHTPSIIALFEERVGKVCILMTCGVKTVSNQKFFFAWQVGLENLPKYVWIVESDAFFTGNIRDFVRHYMPDKTDYIGKYKTVDPGWCVRLERT